MPAPQSFGRKAPNPQAPKSGKGSQSGSRRWNSDAKKVYDKIVYDCERHISVIFIPTKCDGDFMRDLTNGKGDQSGVIFLGNIQCKERWGVVKMRGKTMFHIKNKECSLKKGSKPGSVGSVEFTAYTTTDEVRTGAYESVMACVNHIATDKNIHTVLILSADVEGKRWGTVVTPMDPVCSEELMTMVKESLEKVCHVSYHPLNPEIKAETSEIVHRPAAEAPASTMAAPSAPAKDAAPAEAPASTTAAPEQPPYRYVQFTDGIHFRYSLANNWWYIETGIDHWTPVSLYHPIFGFNPMCGSPLPYFFIPGVANA